MTAPIHVYDSVSGAVEGAPAQGSQSELRLTKTNAAVLAPGRFVTRDGHDRKCKVPTSVAEVLACQGIVELTDLQILSSNNSGNYPVNTRLSVVRKGVIWMVAVTAATQGQPVYVYYGAGDATLRGKCGGSFSGGENQLLPGAKFATTQATPGSLVAVEVDLPGAAGANPEAPRFVTAIVTYLSGVPTLTALAGVAVADTTTGKFTLTAAGATQVLPHGAPIVERATDSTTGALPVICEVGALAATAVTYSVLVQQADDQLFDVADPAEGTIFYVPLQIQY